MISRFVLLVTLTAYVHDRYEACHHCLKSLETPVGMLQRLSKDKELTLPIADHMPSVDVSSFAFCPG